MKKHLSVLALHLRAMGWRLPLVLLGMAAVDAAGYFWCVQRGGMTFTGNTGGFSLLLLLSFAAGVLACQMLLCICFGSNSRFGYTLRRLRISERQVFVWSFVGDLLCFLIVWCVQIICAAGLMLLYQRSAGYTSGAQGVFVDFYRNSTLHGLLPLADGFVVGRNIAFLLLLAASTAYLQQRQHRKVKRFPFWCIATALGVVRLLPVDYSTSSSGGVITAVAALFFTVIFVMLALSQAHDGLEGLTDELD